jgi:integrase
MQWSDVVQERINIGGRLVEIALWRIPAERTKNGREHLLPLSPQVERVLKELRPMPGGGVWVFPSPRRTGEPLGECNKAFARWREGAEVGAIRHSDIRRTVTTGLSRLGFRLEIRQAILNHTPQDVTRRHYDRHDQIPEMRQALCRWGNEVDRIVSGKAEASKVSRIG